MKASISRRTITIVLLLGLLALSTTPAGTAAAPAQFALSISSGRPGQLVEIQQADPCPNTGNYQWVIFTFLDAANVRTESVYPLVTDIDGTWPSTSPFYIPHKQINEGGPFIPTREASDGTGRFSAKCLDFDTGAMTLEYELQPFTVIGPSLQYTVSPRLVRPGDAVHIASDDSCPVPTAQVRVTLASYYGLVYEPEVDPADGSWTVDTTVPTAVWDSMQNQYVDIPLATYPIKVECDQLDDFAPDASYGMQTLEVRTAPVRYVALGDSFSSGEGSFDYIDPNDACHRSETAYPYLLANAFNYGDANLVACSGAVTQDIWGSSPAKPPQRDQLTTLTEVVTITIGGNDALFAEALDACVTRPPYSGSGCRNDQDLNDRISDRLDLLSGATWDPTDPSAIHPLLQVYREIHGRAPEAHIYVGGYPDLFGGDFNSYTLMPDGYQCQLATPLVYVTYEDALWLNSKAFDLNIVIAQAVHSAQLEGIPITYVAPDSFYLHGLCDGHESWINGLVLTDEAPPQAKAESFHPKPIGHFNGYTFDFADAIIDDI